MRRLLLALALCLSVPSVGHAAVAYVTNVPTYAASGTSTLTMAAVAAGTNGTIVVGISLRDTGSVTSSNVQFNGSSTGVTTFQTVLTTGGVATTVYCIANANGTHDVTATISSGVVPVAGVALVFSGADTTTPCGGVQTGNTAAAGTSTTAVSCAASGMEFDIIGHRDDSVTITSTQTQRSLLPSSPQGSIQQKSSTAAGGASTTMAYTWAGSVSYNHVAGCLTASAGGGTTVRGKLLKQLGEATITLDPGLLSPFSPSTEQHTSWSVASSF